MKLSGKINQHDCILTNADYTIDVDKWQALVDMIADIYGAASGVIVQLRHNEFNVVSTSQNENNFLSRNVSWSIETESFCRKVIETEKCVYVNDPEHSPKWSKTDPVCRGPVRSYLGYPIYWPDKSIFGTICAIDTKATAYESSFIDLLGQLRKIIEGELQHFINLKAIQTLLQEQQHQEIELRKLALYDHLTSCANRVLLEERLQTNIARALRHNSHFSLLYFDLNDFKPINDTYGHKVGDHVLTEVSKRIRPMLRDTDLMARVGGDEFVILYENSVNCDQAITKFQDLISQPIHVNGICLTISSSFGASHFPDDGDNMDKLMDIADKRMYRQKHQKTSHPVSLKTR